MIKLKNISLDFGSQNIFKNLTVSLSSNNKIAIFGDNGAGKTTLFKILTNSIDYSGNVEIPKKLKISYLPQTEIIKSDKTVLEEAVINKNSDSFPIQDYEVEIVLDGLGFGQRKYQKISSLSTGWQMRLLLAKTLINKADFYLFDEPTNHLDIETKEWFLKKLNKLPGFLLITHDKYFLEKVPEKILHIKEGNARLYHGNLISFNNQKKLEEEENLKKYLKQKKEKEEKQKIADKFRAKASKAKMAQSILKKIEKMEIVEPEKDINKNIKFNFGQIIKPGKVICQANNINFSYKENIILKNCSLEVNKGEKIALIAANGLGKTTLLKIIAKRIGHSKINYGNNVSVSYFEQDNIVSMPQEKFIIDYICEETETPTSEAQSFLGSFLFSQEDIYKKISVLSGGEKSRLCMAKTLLKKANFLLLDEPTNHLDLRSKENLLKALQDYPETIIFVSHDQDFINNLATRVIKINNHKIESYLGNYDFYLENNTTNNIHNKQPENNIAHKKILIIKQHDLEKEIKKSENRIKNYEQKLFVLDYTSQKFKDVLEKINREKDGLEKLTTEWEEIYETIDK